MTLVNGGTFIVALIALIVELIKSQQEN
ncbi:putative holin-like toxin, partial [Limosilactobacillus fermentum]